MLQQTPAGAGISFGFASTCHQWKQHRCPTATPPPLHERGPRFRGAISLRYSCSHNSKGRLAQRESASFTPKRSLVRSQYRPPRQFSCFRSQTRHPPGLSHVPLVIGSNQPRQAHTPARVNSSDTVCCRSRGAGGAVVRDRVVRDRGHHPLRWVPAHSRRQTMFFWYPPRCRFDVVGRRSSGVTWSGPGTFVLGALHGSDRSGDCDNPVTTPTMCSAPQCGMPSMWCPGELVVVTRGRGGRYED